MFVNNIDKAMEALVEEVGKLKKKANRVIPLPMPVKKITVNLYSSELGKVSESYFMESRLFTTTLPETVDKKLLHLQSVHDKEVTELTLTHKNNEEALANNILVKNKVKELMSSIGIGETKYVTLNPGKRSAKSVQVKAGYVEDLDRCIITDDGYDSAMRTLKDIMEHNNRVAGQAKQKLLREIAEKERAAKEKEKERQLAYFQVKYGVGSGIGWYDILKTICTKDKYLSLAHAMLSVRNDWSWGFGLVETALNNFNVETKEDRLINDEIQSILNNDERDGRVFRDCEHNYEYLFALVDKALLEDYNSCYENI